MQASEHAGVKQTKSAQYPGRLALQQRVLPGYRRPFLEALAAACPGGLSIFAGEPRPSEAIQPLYEVSGAQIVPARNRQLGDTHSSYFLCWQSGILRWLDNWGPEALIVEANPRYLGTRQALRWMHSRGRPVIGWGLGAPPLSGPLASLRRYERRSFLNQLDAIIAYSRRGAEQYRQLGIPEDKVFVATNAVSPAPSWPPPPRPEDFSGRPVVLFVGRLQPRKRLDLLLQACSSIPENKQPELAIVGDGPARDELKKLAALLYTRAEFAGARQGAELEAYFRRADLFVLPGTGGLAVQQAMGYGLPVIVAEGDGTQDDLVRAENGWHVTPGSLPELVSVLNDALSDASRLRRMGAASYRIVAEEINVEAMVAMFVRVVNGVAGR
jgi:glycosyltransferase involved in cell wall biosynthesis